MHEALKNTTPEYQKMVLGEKAKGLDPQKAEDQQKLQEIIRDPANKEAIEKASEKLFKKLDVAAGLPDSQDLQSNKSNRNAPEQAKYDSTGVNQNDCSLDQVLKRARVGKTDGIIMFEDALKAFTEAREKLGREETLQNQFLDMTKKNIVEVQQRSKAAGWSAYIFSPYEKLAYRAEVAADKKDIGVKAQRLAEIKALKNLKYVKEDGAKEPTDLKNTIQSINSIKKRFENHLKYMLAAAKCDSGIADRVKNSNLEILAKEILGNERFAEIRYEANKLVATKNAPTAIELEGMATIELKNVVEQINIGQRQNQHLFIADSRDRVKASEAIREKFEINDTITKWGARVSYGVKIAAITAGSIIGSLAAPVVLGVAAGTVASFMGASILGGAAGAGIVSLMANYFGETTFAKAGLKNRAQANSDFWKAVVGDTISGAINGVFVGRPVAVLKAFIQRIANTSICTRIGNSILWNEITAPIGRAGSRVLGGIGTATKYALNSLKYVSNSLSQHVGNWRVTRTVTDYLLPLVKVGYYKSVSGIVEGFKRGVYAVGNLGVDFGAMNLLARFATRWDSVATWCGANCRNGLLWLRSSEARWCGSLGRLSLSDVLQPSVQASAREVYGRRLEKQAVKDVERLLSYDSPNAVRTQINQAGLPRNISGFGEWLTDGQIESLRGLTGNNLTRGLSRLAGEFDAFRGVANVQRKEFLRLCNVAHRNGLGKAEGIFLKGKSPAPLHPIQQATLNNLETELALQSNGGELVLGRHNPFTMRDLIHNMAARARHDGDGAYASFISQEAQNVRRMFCNMNLDDETARLFANEFERTVAEAGRIKATISGKGSTPEIIPRQEDLAIVVRNPWTGNRTEFNLVGKKVVRERSDVAYIFADDAGLSIEQQGALRGIIAPALKNGSFTPSSNAVLNEQAGEVLRRFSIWPQNYLYARELLSNLQCTGLNLTPEVLPCVGRMIRASNEIFGNTDKKSMGSLLLAIKKAGEHLQNSPNSCGAELIDTFNNICRNCRITPTRISDEVIKTKVVSRLMSQGSWLNNIFQLLRNPNATRNLRYSDRMSTLREIRDIGIAIRNCNRKTLVNSWAGRKVSKAAQQVDRAREIANNRNGITKAMDNLENLRMDIDKAREQYSIGRDIAAGACGQLFASGFARTAELGAKMPLASGLWISARGVEAKIVARSEAIEQFEKMWRAKGKEVGTEDYTLELNKYLIHAGAYFGEGLWYKHGLADFMLGLKTGAYGLATRSIFGLFGGGSGILGSGVRELADTYFWELGALETWVGDKDVASIEALKAIDKDSKEEVVTDFNGQLGKLLELKLVRAGVVSGTGGTAATKSNAVSKAVKTAGAGGVVVLGNR